MRIGMLTDYPAVEFCNGPALASQTFRRNMEARGHSVSLIGPRPKHRKVTGDAVLFNSLPLRSYADTPIALPWPRQTFEARPWDVIHAHSNALMMHWAPMMRELHQIPCLQTNTIHLPSFVHHGVSEKLLNGPLRGAFSLLSDFVERSFCSIYDNSDGLIVQCQGLVDYWRRIGLKVPLHIIPRPIDLRVFEQPVEEDPYRIDFKRGARLFVACRHAKEKSLDQLLRIFAEHVLPALPEASLTLIGDGPAHRELRQLAERLGVDGRCDFVGEHPHCDLPQWYAHGDLFCYPSLSETFGQVVSEALWMGMPVIGFDDGMGVAYQVKDQENGRLLSPGDEAGFGAAIVELLRTPERRAQLSEEARRRQRALVHPERVYRGYEEAYAQAIEHIKEYPPRLAKMGRLRRNFNLFTKHIYPWTWKHLTVLALGSFSTSYRPNRKVNFDAAPSPAPLALKAPAELSPQERLITAARVEDQSPLPIVEPYSPSFDEQISARSYLSSEQL